MNNDVKDIYNKLLVSDEIHEKYEMVSINEAKRGGWAFHNFQHIKNVTRNVEIILKDLGFSEDIIYKAKIAGLLHDTGAVEGKEGHADRSYLYAKKYFSDNNINFSDIDLVLEAIKIHSGEVETDNVIALSLILADKLDLTKSRISDVGKTIVGNRQYMHVEDVEPSIIDGVLVVNYTTDHEIDFDEINEYYFTKKIFKAIKSFAEKMNLDYKILMDGREWIL